MTEKYSFSRAGLKISKDRNKDLQQSLNRKAASALKRAEKVQELERELNAIEISLNGMNGIHKVDTIEQIVALKERRAEIREKLISLSKPVTKTQTKKRPICYRPFNRRVNTGDSVNTTVTIRAVDGDNVTFDEPETVATEDKTPWHGRSAPVSSVKRGKSCKSNKPKRAKRMPEHKINESEIVERVFNERTDVPKNCEMQHMTNSDYVKHINSPEREADIAHVMAQSEKGTTKKQGGSPNGGSKPRFIRECPRTRLIKAGLPFAPMGNE